MMCWTFAFIFEMGLIKSTKLYGVSNNGAERTTHVTQWICSIFPMRTQFELCGVCFVMIRKLEWRHNERDGGSNHRCLDFSLSCLFRRRSKKSSKLFVSVLCEGNLPVTGGFPSQRASNAENYSIWWRHHDTGQFYPYLSRFHYWHHDSHTFNHTISLIDNITTLKNMSACITRI